MPTNGSKTTRKRRRVTRALCSQINDKEIKIGGGMKLISTLNLGFGDAENYRSKSNKELFNSIFVRNIFLEHLLKPSTYFLIGEKGTGKTAYSVFLTNNNYKETISQLKFLRETDYQKFVTLKKEKHLQLSDYSSIWKVILLLLLSKSIKSEELDHYPFSKKAKLDALMRAVDEYYANAFSPEIISVLHLIENSKLTAELISKYLKLGGEQSVNMDFQESRFQVNLLYIQNQFEKALSQIKIKSNHLIFIDGIDVRPGLIPFKDYLDCVKGLADAVWSLNHDFLSNIKDSKGRLRVVLLVRPDIFNSLGLQNAANKVRDNSVYLDWRTTYPSYRSSQIFELSDRLLSANQGIELPLGEAWDYYFPWKSPATNYAREYDPSFYKFLRLSYSRPRDLVTLLSIMQEEYIEKKCTEPTFPEKLFDSYDFQNKYSEYLLGGIRDQLSFYYHQEDYDLFLKFFSFLKGSAEFTYDQYVCIYNEFQNFILEKHIAKHNEIPEFVESAESFLQFLYDTNIICYIEELEREPFFRWCYRERSPSNISPKVRLSSSYRIHYGLLKALNLGFQKMK